MISGSGNSCPRPISNGMKLSEVLKERGYAYQFSSEKLEEITDGAKRTVYLGIDPSADSLHVGNLQAMLVLRRFLEDGHKVILLIGGGTGMIGDPSGKSEERNLLDDATIEKNAAGIEAQAKRLFTGLDFQMVNNAEWLRSLNLIEFLRDVGKHFSVNAMLQRDSVKERLGKNDAGISYTEFSYMLLQAYDFLHLNGQYGCDVQIGASDQWGNIVSGVDLIRRKGGREAYGFTSPLLINKSTGKKFGKSEDGAVWLDPQKTSPFKFYQFFLNVEDAALEELLLRLTMLQKAEIDIALEMHKRNPGARHGQQILAREVTTLVHGADATAAAEKISQALFGDSGLTGLSKEEIAVLVSAAPSASVAAGDLLLDTLVTSALASSKREARQFLASGAITLNGETVNDEKRKLAQDDFSDGIALLKRGARAVCVLRLS